MQAVNKFTQELEFDDSKHQYRFRDYILPSVTEIIAPITTSKYAISAAVVEQAAYRGSAVHEITADFDRGELAEEISMDIASYLSAWSDFVHDYGAKWEFIELPLAGEARDTLFAGTVDRIGEIDGKKVIVDIKSSAGMDRAQKISAATQIYAYSILAIENGIITHPSDGLIVHLDKKCGYHIYHVDEIFRKYHVNLNDLWDKCLDIHVAVKGEQHIGNETE